MKVLTSVEELEHDAFDGGRGYRMTRLLCVVVDDLQEIMLGVLKHHEYALVLEHDLAEFDDIAVAELTAETHFANCTLRYSRVTDLLALLIRLELLDGEFPGRFAATADGLVDSPIGSGANEADDPVSVSDADLGLVAGGSVMRFYMTSLVSMGWESNAMRA